MSFTNKIIVWQDTGRTERVLWIDYDVRTAAFIDVLDKNAWPVLRPLDEFEEALSQRWVEVSRRDPYVAPPLPEDSIVDSARGEREKAWSAIVAIVEDPDRRIFHHDQKRKLITRAAETADTNRISIYRYLRRYWQRGQVKNALLPRYDLRGVKGKRLDLEPNAKKRGRLRKGESEDARVGTNITRDILEKFRKGWQKYYMGKERSLKEAYDLTMEEHFADEYERIDGQKVAVWHTWDDKPTFGQFKSHYYREKRGDFKTFTVRDVGEAAFGRDHRPVLGSSSQAAFGSGAYLQIDCTPSDIYQANSLDRSRNIGRGTLYTATDVFAHYLRGFCLLPGPPSWLGLTLVLENAFADKVPFCAAYGIDIGEGDWPGGGLTEAVVLDRALENLGENSNRLTDELGIRVENNPPYRPDMKGLVESFFARVKRENQDMEPPGLVTERKPGDPDYRLQAALTSFELRKLFIDFALEYNQHYWIEDYRPDIHIIRDDIDFHPLELWNWGLANRTGTLWDLPPEVVRASLLPTVQATVTEHGIYFSHLYYVCERGFRENWLSRARTRRFKVTFIHDPRNVSVAFIRAPGTLNFEPCELVDSQKVAFAGCTLEEVNDHFDKLDERQKAAEERKRQSKAYRRGRAKGVIEEAVTKTGEALQDRPMSKRERLADIGDNRRAEKRRQDYRDSVSPYQDAPPDRRDRPRPPDPDALPSYIPPEEATDDILAAQDEFWGEDEEDEA